jgi:non-hemolytic enterotoxin B/C
MTTDTVNQGAQDLSDSSKVQCSQGILVQGYCNTVLLQPSVLLSGSEGLENYETDINDGLKVAKDNANFYLNTVQPLIIKNVSNIDDYCNLYQTVPAILPEGSSEEAWIEVLSAIKQQAQLYENDAAQVVKELEDYNKGVSEDASTFAGIVSEMNVAVSGDTGALESLQGQLDSIDSKIAGCIAAISLGALAVVGGTIAVAVAVAVGVAATVGGSVSLYELNDSKAKLLTQQSSLKEEVKMASAMSSAYTTLGNQAQQALAAAQQMQQAWTYLNSDLDTLVANLDKGIISTGKVRELFLTTANGSMASVKTDVGIIKGQMTGIDVQIIPANLTVSQYLKQLPKAA